MIYLVERESVSSITLRKVIVNTSFNEVIIIELHSCILLYDSASF